MAGVTRTTWKKLPVTSVTAILRPPSFDRHPPVTPDPKTVLWYDAGHGLNQHALFDRQDWLHEQIGIDPR